MKKLLVAVTISMFLIGCSSDKEKFYQTDLKGVTEHMENNVVGFILVVTDNDEYFIDDVKKVANQKGVKIAMYNVYQPTIGKEENRPNFPYANDLKGNTLYFITDNEVQAELNVSKYADLQLTEEILNFVENHK